MTQNILNIAINKECHSEKKTYKEKRNLWNIPIEITSFQFKHFFNFKLFNSLYLINIFD